MLERLPDGLEGDHERVGGEVRGLESEGEVERCGTLVEGIYRDRADCELVGGAEGALQGVEQEAAAEACALMRGGDCEAGEERNGDREVS